MHKFQSTHPHRVRHAIFLYIVRHALFQSTHPHRVRLRVVPSSIRSYLKCITLISHIGCDLESYRAAAHEELFQSTHPHRVRRIGTTWRSGFARFQSTHPHRVRLVRLLNLHAPIKFQSTHPHRVRPRCFTENSDMPVSIHAPT